MEAYNRQFDTLYGEIMDHPNMQEYSEAIDDLNALLQWMTGLLQGCAQGQDPASF
jgi:cell fate (sporulation/competence/biofilm development) regulator YmcA (YheA/YmcA/DUF963 family)